MKDKKNAIKIQLDALMALPFPENANGLPENWFSDLVEVDGYYAGLASSVLAGKPDVFVKNIDDILELKLRLIRVSPAMDRDAVAKYKDYIDVLEKLAALLLRNKR